MSSDSRLSVLIADDQLLLAESLRQALEPQYKVVAIVGDGVAAIQGVERHLPDILLLDISMPVMNGLQAAEHIAQYCPSVRIIFLTCHTDHIYIEEAFNRGAAGYVRKGSIAELDEAIHSSGRPTVSPHLRPLNRIDTSVQVPLR